MCLELLPRLKLLEDNFHTFYKTENSRAQREQVSAHAESEPAPCDSQLGVERSTS
jgi:hypothetical protein